VSGIFGVFDPEGADAGLVETAAGAVSYRGEPEVRGWGRLACGAFTREGDAPWYREDDTSVLVADARIDAAIPGMPVATIGGGGLGLLQATLSQLGPTGLEGLAAEYAAVSLDLVSGTLLVVRDHVGARPLFWARRAGRFGFACDPKILIALGLATGQLDRDGIISTLAGGSIEANSTGFAGIARVRCGRFLKIDAAGSISGGRWFRPERVPVERMDLREAAARVRSAVCVATEQRAREGPVALTLSSGRDSGSVAVALGVIGIKADCLTLRFDDPGVRDETSAAEKLARAVGHRWRDVSVAARATEADMAQLAKMSGTPLGLQVFPVALALVRALEEIRPRVLMDGHGGEPLLTAPPVAVLDLIRGGHLMTAIRATRGFAIAWGTPYSVTAKEILRAVAPVALVEIRERHRRTPPWLTPIPTVRTKVRRSARDYVVDALLAGEPDQELVERMLQPQGVRYTSPLLDLRVTRAALSIPVEHKVPAPEPKPVLRQAFLGDWAASRAKAPQTRYFERLAKSLQDDFPRYFDRGSLSVLNGFTRAEGLVATREQEWLVASLALVPLEAWLRHGGS
jgi:asparagine synthase (glutamine-hydrolysing)